MPYGSLDAAKKITDRQQYQNLVGRLKSERASFDAHWKEISDWLLPRRARFTVTDRNKGDKRNQNIINSTGKFAQRTLSSGMHAGLTSPARPWFKLSIPDQDLAGFGVVKNWLHVTTQRMVQVFLTTNLYNNLPTIYGDIGAFGTAAMSVMQDSKDLFRCYTYPIGSYWCGLDNRGNIATFVHEKEMTVRQVVTEFAVVRGTRLIDWSKISRAVHDMWDRGDYEAAVKVTWVVMPNDNPDPTKVGAQFKPFKSCHFETLDERDSDNPNRLLRESGFDTFPVMVPRWEVTDNDTYGTDCPGMTALGDIKQLQTQERRKGQAIAKMVDPALQGPPSLRTQKTSLLPGDVTYVDASRGQEGLRPIHDVNLRIDHLTADMGGVEYRIRRAFYEDLFLMLASSDPSRGAQPVTAREVEERHEEKLLALGPVLERTNDELLEPMIDRVYLLMADAGLLPPVPEELDGVKLSVEYLSIMAQAQKLVGLVGQDRFMSSILPMLQVEPSVRYKVDWNRTVDNYGEMTGVDPRMIVDTDAAQAAADAAAQAANAQAQATTLTDTASAVQKLGDTPTGTGSVLDRIASAAASGAVA